MSSSLQNLILEIEELERNVSNLKLSSSDSDDALSDLRLENKALRDELNNLKKDYKTLQETSKEVIDELNHSIGVIEEYFEKQNADNKDIKS